jgi:hypothetical protein
MEVEEEERKKAASIKFATHLQERIKPLKSETLSRGKNCGAVTT